MVVTVSDDRRTGSTGFGHSVYSKGHAARVEGVVVRNFTIGFNPFFYMDAGIYPWADVVDDGAIRQGFFNALMACVVHKLKAAAGCACWGVSTCACNLGGHVPAIPCQGASCACELVAVGIVSVSGILGHAVHHHDAAHRMWAQGAIGFHAGIGVGADV